MVGREEGIGRCVGVVLCFVVAPPVRAGFLHEERGDGC